MYSAIVFTFITKGFHCIHLPSHCFPHSILRLQRCEYPLKKSNGNFQKAILNAGNSGRKKSIFASSDFINKFEALNHSTKAIHTFMSSVIHLEDIKKDYYLGKEPVTVLKGIDLDIKRNEYVALMGPSGSGKSTLMNILGCLDAPTSGKYILNGQDVSHMVDDDLAAVRNKEIGFVFQQFNLLPRLTALENVAVPLTYAGVNKKDRLERAREMLSQVGLGDRSGHKPNELSGGQCQRVAIARALINNPSLILADEPTGNLDTKTSIEIMTMFEEIQSKGNTVVLVTHEEDIADHALRIVRIRDGFVEKDEANTPHRVS